MKHETSKGLILSAIEGHLPFVWNTDLHSVSYAVDSNTGPFSPLSKLLQQKEQTKENLLCFNAGKNGGGQKKEETP
jgi:hypothetical protein